MTHSCIVALMMAFLPVSVPKVMPRVVEPNRQSGFVYTKNNEHHVLILYYSPYCPYSQKVLKYIKNIHKQVPMKNVADDPQAKAEFKKLGGKMQVPCLVIDGRAMYESNDIINWLSQHQGELEATNNTAACRITPKMVQKLALRRMTSTHKTEARQVGQSNK